MCADEAQEEWVRRARRGHVRRELELPATRAADPTLYFASGSELKLKAVDGSMRCHREKLVSDLKNRSVVDEGGLLARAGFVVDFTSRPTINTGG